MKNKHICVFSMCSARSSCANVARKAFKFILRRDFFYYFSSSSKNKNKTECAPDAPPPKKNVQIANLIQERTTRGEAS